MSSVDELQDRVSESLEAGYRRVKLKICPGWDLVPVAAVRDRFGENLMLQVDANSAYQRATSITSRVSTRSACYSSSNPSRMTT